MEIQVGAFEVEISARYKPIYKRANKETTGWFLNQVGYACLLAREKALKDGYNSTAESFKEIENAFFDAYKTTVRAK